MSRSLKGEFKLCIVTDLSARDIVGTVSEVENDKQYFIVPVV